MKKIFVRTKNVKGFISIMNNLLSSKESIPKMGLIYGEPGLGKTQTAIWWATNNNAIYIRAKNQMSTRWLLMELAEELGLNPKKMSVDLFKQCVEKLKAEPQLIVVDEIDYLLFSKSRAIETLRDIHDQAFIPIVLIGMGMANRKLSGYKHLYDRVTEKLMFETFSSADIKTIINDLSEVNITDEAIEMAFSKFNRFRQITKQISLLEKIALTNGLKQIDASVIKGAKLNV